MRAYVVVGAVVGVILADVAGSLGGDPGKEAEADKVARLIRQLGDDAFEKREAASKELVALGAPALAAVRKAAVSSDDPEIRARAQSSGDAIAAAIARAAEAVVKAELDKLQGAWAMASHEVEGKPLPGIDKRSTLTITGRKWVMKWVKEDGGEQVESGILTLGNLEKAPLAVDVVHLGGPRKGSTVFAIIRVDRDTFQFCYCVRAEERPTEFATKTGDAGCGLITYERQKR